MQKFLRIPLIRRDDLTELHQKSRTKPSLHYLTHLKEIREKLAHTEFSDQIMDPEWDEHAPVGQTFQKICNARAGTIARWRGGSCGDWTGLI
mmetsp:Transcript_23040/g.54767  ORF Transcript_23040/g.54767 Transcript_23040/m.54767 type:complete len:92 (+) Transcript_23040:372-647(+)